MLGGFLSLALATVSFSAPAAPAGRLLPALGNALGVRLEADGRMKGEVLLISVRDVRREDLLKRIADATSGEWEHREGVYHLVLNGAVDARQRKAEALERAKAWIDTAARQSEMRTKGRFSDGAAGAGERIVAAIPPETLGTLRPKERLVYSTNPTSMQRRLPASWLKGVDLSHLSRRNTSTIGAETLPPPGPPSVALFILQSDGMGRNLAYNLIAADARGTAVGSESGTLWPSSGVATRPKLSRLTEKLVLSKEVLERARAISRTSDSMGNYEAMNDDEGFGDTAVYTDADLTSPPVSCRVPEILQPEKSEPLALVAGPFVQAAAVAEDRNLVADLPDAAFGPMATFAAQNEPTVAALGLNAPSLELDIAEDESWLVVRPGQPASARDARLDRTALGTALRIVDKSGTLDLDAQAAYAEAQPLVSSGRNFEAQAFGLVSADWGKRMARSYGRGERELLRLYRALGSWSKADRRTVGSLPLKAREVLDSLVFNAFSGPSISLPYSAFGLKDRNGLIGSSVGYESTATSVLFERTVFWGRGIPANAVLSAKESSESAFFGVAASGARPRMSSQGYSYSISNDSSGARLVGSSLPRLASYRRGTLRQVTFELSSAEGGRWRRSLSSDALDPGARPIAFEGLPEGIRRNVEQIEESIRRSLEQSPPPQQTGKP